MTTLLSIVQYTAQVLTAILGVHGLLNDYKRDGKLTRAGRIPLVGLATVAMLGIAAKIIDQRLAARRARDAAEAAELAPPLSDLTLSWQLPAATLRLRGQKIDELARLPANRRHDLADVGTALPHGDLERLTSLGRRRLDLFLWRPQGPLPKTYEESSPEFAAFTDALEAMIGDQFEVRTTGGKPVADLTAPWPTDFAIRKGRISAAIRAPTVSPLDLRGESIVVVERGAARPEKLSLSTTDPRVEWNEEIPLTWRRRVLRRLESPEGISVEDVEYGSEPQRIVLQKRVRPTPGQG